MRYRWLYITIGMAGLTASASTLLSGCKKNGDPEVVTTAVNFSVPTGFPAPNYDFAANPLNAQSIALGRRLFYDGQLSKDGFVSCASCHQQFAAFATFDHDLSHGVDNAFTTRNSPALYNLAWQSEFHHDGGIKNLEVQPLAPITAVNEMGETIQNIVTKLGKDESYHPLFTAAYGTPEVTSQRVLKSLTQFMLTLVSATAKYDEVKKGAATFTTTEAAGYALFTAKCATCHREPLFTDLSYRNTGLPLSSYLKDVGRMRITGSKADSLKFKVPSLRNVELTFPYMHDGRFYTLQRAIEHYNPADITQSTTLDPALKSGIPLTATEITQLIAFLKTLTDKPFTTDSRFAQP